MAGTSARARSPQNHGTPLENKRNGLPVALDLDIWQAEALREPFVFTLGGHRFEMPHMADLDWHVGEGPDGVMSAQATIHDLLKAGLAGQWEKFTAVRLSTGGYNKLWQSWQEHSGVDEGESAASPGSSTSTAGQ
jgi:hypothetical protein